jgi:hypothetical protein
MTGPRIAGAGRLALIALGALTACSHGLSNGVGSNAGAGSIGYVQMDQLVQKHPLYEQLARYDRSIAAFDLTSTAPRAVGADPQMHAREVELQKELTAAADRTRTLLDQKQRQYQAQESQAIAAALRGANIGGASAAQIAGSVNLTARQQQGFVAQQAQRDLQSYRTSLLHQNQSQITAAQKALNDRADRTYRAKAEELQSKEAALSLSLANEDAPQRLALHTKLSSLALDDAAREAAQSQLQGLDRKESDALAAQRNRDQQTLATLQSQLHLQVQQQLNAEVSSIEKRSSGSLAARQQIVQRQSAAVGGTVISTASGGRPQPQANPNLPPQLRAKIQQLHDVYQKRFEDDAKSTIAAFEATRADLSRRYAELHGINDASVGGAQAQIVELRKKRDDLYEQIVAQIEREVRVLAQQRGISVVLSDVVAPVGGVDLTPDALKDIESLHE